jgi:guanine nucleotide-binding protein subunit alpha
MGCVSSAESPEKSTNDAIDLQLKKEASRSRNEVKLLLLGSGESGKSTILKQMTLIHGTGYTIKERVLYREIIFQNVVQNMQALVYGCCVRLGLPLAGGRISEHAAKLIDATTLPSTEWTRLPEEIAQALTTLWMDQTIRTAYHQAREFQLTDSSRYYFEELERLRQPNYMPTDQDILRSRVKTTGIVETSFRIGDLTYR